jgi:peroxisomal membrane protein 4
MDLQRNYNWVLKPLKGLSHGIYYGAKVRFTHAFVMSILYGNGSVIKRIKTIIRLTSEHSVRLGIFVFIYKLAAAALSITNNLGNLNSFISGAVAGKLIYSKQTQVNIQMIHYLLSRVVTGSIHLLYKSSLIPNSETLSNSGFPLLAVVCWGFVMYLYEKDKTCLQPSLQSSMYYLYDESNSWKDWRDFVPFREGLTRLYELLTKELY